MIKRVMTEYIFNLDKDEDNDRMVEISKELNCLGIKYSLEIIDDIGVIFVKKVEGDLNGKEV